jgi:hypothetical protein
VQIGINRYISFIIQIDDIGNKNSAMGTIYQNVKADSRS